MENAIQVFNNEEFGEVRTVLINDVVWFVATDVCRALEIKNVSDALKNFDDDEKMTIDNTDSHSGQRGGAQMFSVISEPGLYRLIATSRKPKTKAFQRWLYHEVLPTIRKHGIYATPATAEAILNDPDIMIEILQALKAERAKIAELKDQNAILNQQVAEFKPKASYYDVVLNCKDLVSISKIAKDFGMSAVQMNTLLHELHIQFKQGKTWLLYQDYAQLGWTSTKTHVYIGDDGANHSNIHTYWTQKGRLGIYEILKKNGYLPTIEKKVA